ncbi:beta-N-acetylhexosaminidase [Streptosporangium sp. NPDC000396]|uniref:beta-N-acetylhexosaminidase n=1 Tax=Streptosporangium sp. NPDC000396 TaxID=3366185 RepID=UPI0036A99640
MSSFESPEESPTDTVIPRPILITAAEGCFVLTEDTVIASDPAFEHTVRWLRGALGPATRLPLLPGSPGPGTIQLVRAADLAEEAYRLQVTSGAVRIEAGGPAGAFYGAQTLRQLLPADAFRAGPLGHGPWSIPAVTIADAPRFAWRGVLIDVARRFLPKNDLLRYIDLLAMHKLNVLHLHLTDDQGWRLEIKRFPRLAEVGAWRRESSVGAAVHEKYDGRPHGGYYTQDDIREIVAYAADRFITVVPEIDLPGHTQAAIAAYPELGNLDESLPVGTTWGVNDNVLNVEDRTIAFFKAVLDEVLELFPGDYVCIGGDEVPKKQWRDSPRAKERIRELGLRDEDELQSWFIRQFTEYLIACGRRPYGWDEILEGGLPRGTTVASWRGTFGAVTAARLGHDVVTCPFTELYLDFRQSGDPAEPVPIGSIISLENVYGFEPVPSELTEEESRHILGAQANIWTEHIDSARHLDYMAFPRLAAFAEVVWGQRQRAFADFRRRLRSHERRLEALGVEFRPESGPHPWQSRPDAPGLPRDFAEVNAQVEEWTTNIVAQYGRPRT